MKNRNILFGLLTGVVFYACGTKPVVMEEPSLKSVLGDKFLIGVALNTRQAAGIDTASVAIVKKHFNAVVAENCMI